MTDHQTRGPIHPAGPLALGGGHRIAPITPAVYQEDPLFVAWCEALDELLAPVTAALDCFPAYLDPRLAPADFLGWLGTLVGLDTPEELRGPVIGARPAEGWGKMRERVSEAVASYEQRGTVAGLRAAVAGAAGVPLERVAVEEPGCVVWASRPGAAPLPSPGWGVRVLVRAARPMGPEAVSACLSAARRAVPVQFQVHVEVVES